jgi:ribosome recycling factor
LDNVQISIKGKKYKLSELSTIMVRGANILVINPYEEDHKESIIKGVESSKLDVQINVEDTNVVVTLGAIPSDIKIENVQAAKRFADNSKDRLKSIRQSCNNEFKKLEKIIGKDEGRRLETQILDVIERYFIFIQK